MTLKGKSISREDGLGTGVTQVRVLNAGALQIRTVPGITASAFLRTSETGFTVRAENPQQRASEGKETVTLGVRLTGRFPSALAGGPAADAAGGKTAPAVVVFSDVDMLTGPLAAAAPAGGNADLVLSTLEELTGSVSLASIKARGRIIRPFSAVDRMEEDFEDATASAAAALQAEIAAGESELAGLARKSREGEESLLKEEILRSRKLTEAKVARAKEELAALQHRKRAMVESHFTAWKVFILLAGPVLVLLIPASVLAARLLGRVEWTKRKPWTRGI